MNHMNDQMGMHDISIISIENSILGVENFQQKFYWLFLQSELMKAEWKNLTTENDASKIC